MQQCKPTLDIRYNQEIPHRKRGAYLLRHLIFLAFLAWPARFLYLAPAGRNQQTHLNHNPSALTAGGTSQTSTMSNKGGGAASLKQGNLFSFFAKKKPSAAAAAGGTSASSAGNNDAAAAKKEAAAASSAGPSASSSSSSSSSPTKVKGNANNDAIDSANNNSDNGVTASRSTNPRGAVSSKQAALLAKVHVGCTVAVYWPDDAEYYPAKVRCVGLGRQCW